MLAWLMGWRLLRRELKSGELTVLALALLVAVAAMSSVAFFADRIDSALTRQASQLLAADLVVNGRAPAEPAWQQRAQAQGLRQVPTAIFPSMVFAREQAVLANLKAVASGYPLRGEVQIRTRQGVKQGVYSPAPGEVWADARLLQKMGLQLGDSVRLGSRSLVLAAEVLREPDGAVDVFNFIPRVLLNHADLAATGLVQDGSRIRYRLLLAGDAAQVKSYRDWLAPQLKAGTRLEDIEEARPEVRSALERARRFLGLTAILSVTLVGSGGGAGGAPLPGAALAKRSRATCAGANRARGRHGVGQPVPVAGPAGRRAGRAGRLRRAGAAGVPGQAMAGRRLAAAGLAGVAHRAAVGADPAGRLCLAAAAGAAPRAGHGGAARRRAG